MKHAAVLGAGAWGTALAKTLSEKGQNVALWTFPADIADEIRDRHTNERFLPGVSLSPSLRATGDVAEALDGADLVLVALPSDALRSVIEQAAPHLEPDALIVSATKGIENGSHMLMREVVLDVLGQAADARLCVLSGPSFAQEVAERLPTAVVVASSRSELAISAQKRCATEWLRVYTSDDPAGVELGGALKNVIAIAAGACDGFGFGHNARAAIITRGLAEIVRLATTKGGNPRTLAGLAGLGDLVLTCTGELSRNRTVGYRLAKGLGLGEVLETLGHVAEGVKTARSAYELSRKLDVDMPITAAVHSVLYEGRAPRQAVADLLARALKPEF
jgi:glycerol-3-phosphate dehydrogenase (NAD(P)+)